MLQQQAIAEVVFGNQDHGQTTVVHFCDFFRAGWGSNRRENQLDGEPVER
jgi:hypothetical protein